MVVDSERRVEAHGGEARWLARRKAGYVPCEGDEGGIEVGEDGWVAGHQEEEEALAVLYEVDEEGYVCGVDGDRVDGAFWGWNQVWRDASFAHWNIEIQLKSVKVPMLLIQGQDDAYGTMAQLDRIERRVCGSVLRAELEDCGHSPFRDQFEQTLEHLARFVRALD